MMKRGKDDEKVMGPMFPRLNVNDKEKGGPRAPPRNKMALYEQLSIPSQRFRPPASSCQGNEQETGMYFPDQVPPPRNPTEKPPNRHLDPNAPSAQFRQKQKSGENDLTVPIFVSEVGQNRGKYHNHMNRENNSPSSQARSNYSSKFQSAANKNPKQISNMGVNVRQKEKSQNTQSEMSFPLERRNDPSKKQSEMSFAVERRNDPSKNFSRLQKVDSRLQSEQRVDSQPSGRRCHISDTQSIDINRENSSMSLRNSRFEEQRNLEGGTNYTESHEDRTCNNRDQEDDVSETSMVDSVCQMHISPDDVVGIIGQKHFWKARRAIVNQQRVFAVQVFELHRLMKVQRLIAESPHLLIEDSAFLEKRVEPAAMKKLPLEYILKAPSNVSKHKSEKPNNNMECSAENTVGKASVSTVQNGSHPQPLHYGPFTGINTSPPVANDPNMGAWGFHQPQGHQWLVPVMTPSEGLVYKPYPGPGFTSPGFGSCGPPESTPMMGNFFNQQYQGMGLPTFVPPAGPQGYFPPYGMPVMNPAMSGHAVEEMSQFTSQGLQQQLSGAGANFSVQRQNSSNLPGQKSRANPNAPKLNVCKDSEVQASTASGPTERARGGLDSTVARSNVLPLFPTSPVTEGPGGGGSPKCHEGNQTSQVIRVVPRNGRSATEFAARLFRSIQEERQQHDLV